MYSDHSCSKKFSATFLLALFCATACLFSCKRKNQWVMVDPAFSRYIDAYTSGIVSKTTAIKIQLTDLIAGTHAIGEPVDAGLFDFSPSVKGTSSWIDARTIQFKPATALDPDQLYEVSFHLGKIANVPSKFERFRFNVQTLKPAFSVMQLGLRSAGEKNRMFFLGSLQTADVESPGAIEKMLTATQDGQSLKITWQHNEASREHLFTVEGIARKDAASSLALYWDGASIHAATKDNSTIPIPAIGEFKVLNIMAVNDDEQYASVQFSDPLQVGQELNGLITVSDDQTAGRELLDQKDLTYTINGSEVKVYLGEKMDGNYTVLVNPGVKSTWNDTLSASFSGSIHFENRMPSVQILGKGNILPNSGKLVMPFDATNLSAVDVSIIKIYASNVPQFLQRNNLDGDEELRRVATPIVVKTVRLDEDKSLDLHRLQHFSLDIDKFLKAEPGAIYHITLSFRPEYSLYKCQKDDLKATAGDNDQVSDTYEDGSVDGQDEFWDKYNGYYEGDYDYDWEERNNPCSRSYYTQGKWASRNIMASNIGLVARRGNDNTLSVAVADLLTTAPMGDVDLEVLDYQEQVIAKGKSDDNGLARLEFKRKPYLLIARKGADRGYLKLNDENSLSLSQFDIGGTEIRNGIKGYIFGERGVWRPGDTMYLNCIIEDKDNRLPQGFPVEFNLYNPQGQLYKHLVQPNAGQGFNLFKVATQQSSPTGNWMAKVKAGGAFFSKTIKIETVMPNRLKIELKFGGDSILGKENAAAGKLSAQWLFGAIAKGLKAKVDVALYPQSVTTFSKYKDYTFDNPVASFSTQSKTIFDGTLDDNGNAEVKPNVEVSDNAPGMLNASMLVKVFEPGGAFSTDYMTFPYSPYSSYVGIRLPTEEEGWGYLSTGKLHTAQLVDVDEHGRLMPGNSTIEVQFYKVQWRWWWDNSGDDLSNFTQDQYNKLVFKQTINLQNGAGKCDFSAGASEWGRYMLLVKDLRSGHTTGRILYLDDAGWATRQNGDNAQTATTLSFSSDKTSYNVGDMISLTLPSSKGGRALICLESGTKVLKSFWVETQQGQTVVKFPAEKEMSPNIYAHVTLLQPHAQTINDLPIRMYGILPLLVQDKTTLLAPVITMSDVLRPEQPSSVTVSEKNGKDMTYCIAIVDDGLLSLTHFKTPDPHSAFYAREALGVKNWDLYDNVIGAFATGITQALTLGGDGSEEGPASQKKANRFKPVVLYLGPFHLSKGEKQTHRFVLPPYIGQVRTMVVAANGDGSYGNAEKEVQVKKPLMILATLPRVLGPEETIKLPVSVFAAENTIRDVAVTLQANSFLDITGAATQTIHFTSTGDQMIYFDVKVKSNVGIGKVKVTATSGNEKAVTETELDIRNPNPPVTSVSEKQLIAAQQWKTTVTPIGSAATSKAVIEISSVPPMNLGKRLNYLIEYPYGCIEQTTSAVFPQLVLNQLTDLDDYKKAQVDRNIRAGISRMQDFQRPDGGFSYWPGQPKSDEWGTNYAGHFLLEAADRGYIVSESMLQQWKGYETSKANSWMPQPNNFYGGDLMQAYRLYLLALAKAPQIGAMNRLREFSYLSPEAKWRLAAAYKLIGQDEVALSMVKGLPQTFPQRTYAGITYGSDLRDEAMVLETLTLLGKREQAAEQLSLVTSKLAMDDWYSTQTTAYALIAVAKYCGKNPSGAKIIANVNLNGKATDIHSDSYVAQVPVDIAKGNVLVTVANQGSNLLYVRIISEGQPLPDEELKVNNNPAVLGLTVSYLSQDGKPIDVTKLTEGTDFVAKVTISNPGKNGDYTQMALSQLFPGGWEILNTRMQQDDNAEEDAPKSSFQSSPFDYQDIRDDRVYTYFNIGAKQTLTYYVELNAAYLGKYFLPGTFCGAMYNNTISAGVNGRWIEVVHQ